MIAAERLDALVAAQPFDRHGSIVKPLYRHGLPILTEKPLASSVKVGEEMLDSLRTGGSWHMVGYHKRSDPATEYAKAEIDRLKQTGELGKFRYLRVTMPEGDWIAAGFTDLIQSDEPTPSVPADETDPDMDPTTFSQYVAFVNYYIHQVNLLRFLFGEPYRVTFADRAGVMMAVESESGIPGMLEMSPYKTSIDWQESAIACFERGYVRIDLPAPVALNRPGKVEILREAHGRPPETVVPQMPWVHAMRRQAQNFVSAVRGDRRPPCEAAEALADLKIAKEYIGMLK
jgi:predicted dehydrogenase